MARRATKINEVRKGSQHTVLLLDAGSTLFGEALATQSQGRVVVEAMNLMGYDAMTVGQMDLAQGVEVLLARAKEARFPILSANLVSTKDQQLLLPPYTVLTRDGVRYGILGISEPKANNWPNVSQAVSVLDPVETVKKYLPEVRTQSDVVILLSHLGLDEDKALAQAVPGMDIIIGGRSRKLLGAPERVGQTVITQVGYDGEWLGRLDVTFEQGKLRDAQLEIINLGPEVPDDPQLKALVETYAQKYPTPTPSK